MGGKTPSPRPKSLALTISKHALLAQNRSRPLFGRSKVTLLSPTLSTQTQAEKPKGRGRTVTPPHISDKCVRKTWFPLPIPHSYLVGAKSPSPRKLPSPEPRNLSPSSMAPPTAPNSQPPSSLMPETLSICRRALGRVPLTPCRRSCLDDGRVNRTRADSPPPLFTAPERLQLWIRPESRRCFPVAVDHRDISSFPTAGSHRNRAGLTDSAAGAAYFTGPQDRSYTHLKSLYLGVSCLNFYSGPIDSQWEAAPLEAAELLGCRLAGV